jgi:hypothetical protein
MYDHLDPQHTTYLFTHDYDPEPEAPTEVFPVVVPEPDLAEQTVDIIPFAEDNVLSHRQIFALLFVMSGVLPVACTLGAGLMGFLVGTLLGVILSIVNMVCHFRRLRAIREGDVDAQFTEEEIIFQNVVMGVMGAMVVAKGIEHISDHHAQLVADKLQRNGFGS